MHGVSLSNLQHSWNSHAYAWWNVRNWVILTWVILLVSSPQNECFQPWICFPSPQTKNYWSFFNSDQVLQWKPRISVPKNQGSNSVNFIFIFNCPFTIITHFWKKSHFLKMCSKLISAFGPFCNALKQAKSTWSIIFTMRQILCVWRGPEEEKTVTMRCVIELVSFGQYSKAVWLLWEWSCAGWSIGLRELASLPAPILWHRDGPSHTMGRVLASPHWMVVWWSTSMKERCKWHGTLLLCVFHVAGVWLYFSHHII